MAERVVVVENGDGVDEDHESDSGDHLACEQCESCDSGERADELLLCDRCDRGYHMLCLRPMVTRIPIGPWSCPACSDDNNRLIKSIQEKKNRKELAHKFFLHTHIYIHAHVDAYVYLRWWALI